jgi:hypothetical protein
MTGTQIDDWYDCAVHESGHIVALAHWGFRFKSVWLWRGRSGKVDGRVVQPDISHERDRLACAICCLAGPMATWRLTGVPPEKQDGAGDDLDKCREQLSKVRFRERLGIDSITPFTTELIEHNWQAVQWLACHLAARKALTFNDVVKLISEA